MRIRNPLHAMSRAPVLALAAALSVLSCNETVEPPVATIIQLSPTSATLTALGATIQVAAVVLDQDGQTMTGVPLIWSSGNGAVASVDANGLVTAIGNGVAAVTAGSGAASGSIDIVVLQQVAAVGITPASDTVAVGESTQLVATAMDANMRAVTDAMVTWRSSNPLIALVDQNGFVRGVAGGTVTITAEASGVTGTARVTIEVLPPTEVVVSPNAANIGALGRSVQLTATVYDRNRREIDDATVDWSSDNSAVATVDGRGFVTSYANGTATITARAGRVSGTATVTVAQQVASVTISPPAYNLVEGESVQLAASARDANNRQISGASFTWSSNQPARATVDQTGQVTAVSRGVAIITAASGGFTGEATITIQAIPVVSMTIVPENPSLFRIRATVQLSVEARNAQGQVLSNVNPTWSTSNSTIATVTSTGLVTAVGYGVAQIFARVGSITASTSVTVSRPVARIEVTPSSRGVAVGDSLQLSAIARDAGNSILGAVTFNWSSTDTGVATVSDRGLVHGVSAGKATITAEADGRTGSATITVSKSGKGGGGTISNATSIEMGDSVTAELDEDEEHYYEIDVPDQSGRKTVRLTAWTEGSDDTEGVLYDDDDDEVEDDDDSGPGDNFQIVHEGDAGTYYVKVTGYRGNAAEYTLKVDDHGDSDETATPVGDGETDGYLHANGNIDYFEIVVSGSGLQDIVVETTGGTDTFGELRNSRGTLVEDDDDGGDDNNFQIDTSVRAGTYYVVVSGFEDERTGPYVLEVDGADGTGTTGGTSSSTNSNGSRGDAKTAPIGGAARDTLREDDQMDYFVVSVPNSPRPRVQLTAYTEGRVDLVGELFGVRDTNSVVGRRFPPPGSTDFQITHTVSSGTNYFVRVSGEESDARGTYELRVDDHGDSKESATGVSLSGSRDEIPGDLIETDNEDYFRIEITADETTLDVRTDGNTDTYGELYAGTGTRPLESNDDHSDTERNFRITRVVDEGTYYVVVTGENSSRGEYMLHVDIS